MSIYSNESSEGWTTVDVRGTAMEKRVVWEGDYDVRSAFFNMPAGMRVEPHQHSKWVQVFVLEGRMRNGILAIGVLAAAQRLRDRS